MDEIRVLKLDTGPWYIFENLASVLWPNDLNKSNHEFEKLLIDKLKEIGCHKVNDTTVYIPAVGLLSFDSEADGFECHSTEYFPVEYAKQFIERWFNDLAVA